MLDEQAQIGWPIGYSQISGAICNSLDGTYFLSFYLFLFALFMA